MPGTRLITGEQMHQAVIVEQVLAARSHVWIATADLKDMHVRRGRRFVPVLDALADLARAGVALRVVHGALPSRPFRETLDDYPELVSGGLELQICPRSHWKMVIVDGAFAYCGSANFTGAGLGARAPERRNLEIGVISDEQPLVSALEAEFDRFWIGEHCERCGLRARCPDPIR